MTITIYEGHDRSSVMLGSTDKRFAEKYGNVVIIPTRAIYQDLKGICRWVETELQEDCKFEIK